MSDMSQTNLREPDKTDWDNFNPGSKWVAPPEPYETNADGTLGKARVFTVQLPKDLNNPERRGTTGEGYRKFEIGPLTLVKNGNGADGQQVRYHTVSVKHFTNTKTGESKNVSSAGLLIRAAGINTKPQTNAEYEQAVGQASGRLVNMTMDWRARDKDTGETVEGFVKFPIDPTTGRRKAILKRGDQLTDGTVVKAEVLFANLVGKFIQDPTKK